MGFIVGVKMIIHKTIDLFNYLKNHKNLDYYMDSTYVNNDRSGFLSTKVGADISFQYRPVVKLAFEGMKTSSMMIYIRDGIKTRVASTIVEMTRDINYGYHEIWLATAAQTDKCIVSSSGANNIRDYVGEKPSKTKSVALWQMTEEERFQYDCIAQYDAKYLEDLRNQVSTAIVPPNKTYIINVSSKYYNHPALSKLTDFEFGRINE